MSECKVCGPMFIGVCPHKPPSGPPRSLWIYWAPHEVDPLGPCVNILKMVANHKIDHGLEVIERSAFDVVVAERDFCKTQWDLSSRLWESKCDALAAEVERLKAQDLTHAVLAADVKLREERDALAEKLKGAEVALEFSLEGLAMWRKFQSPGNIAEVEERIRQALAEIGEDGGA